MGQRPVFFSYVVYTKPRQGMYMQHAVLALFVGLPKWQRFVSSFRLFSGPVFLNSCGFRLFKKTGEPERSVGKKIIWCGNVDISKC